MYYFNGHNEQKRHIWFNILFECFANLVLSYGALLKLIELYQLLYFGFTMIDLVQFFTVICALSMLLENQRYETANVNIISYIHDLFILSVCQVQNLNPTPLRNKYVSV